MCVEAMSTKAKRPASKALVPVRVVIWPNSGTDAVGVGVANTKIREAEGGGGHFRAETVTWKELSQSTIK